MVKGIVEIIEHVNKGIRNGVKGGELLDTSPELFFSIYSHLAVKTNS